MKLRQGFVSNSSSSSFIIYAVKYENGDMTSLLRKLNDNYKVIEDFDDFLKTRDLEDAKIELQNNLEIEINKMGNDIFVGEVILNVDPEDGDDYTQLSYSNIKKIEAIREALEISSDPYIGSRFDYY